MLYSYEKTAWRSCSEAHSTDAPSGRREMRRRLRRESKTCKTPRRRAGPESGALADAMLGRIPAAAQSGAAARGRRPASASWRDAVGRLSWRGKAFCRSSSATPVVCLRRADTAIRVEVAAIGKHLSTDRRLRGPSAAHAIDGCEGL